MKKSCYRCRAFTANTCSLGYRISLLSPNDHTDSSNGVPLEQCPKPLTYGDLIFLLQEETEKPFGLNAICECGWIGSLTQLKRFAANTYCPVCNQANTTKPL